VVTIVSSIGTGIVTGVLIGVERIQLVLCGINLVGIVHIIGLTNLTITLVRFLD